MWIKKQVDIVLSDGTLARAAVPSGASTGKYIYIYININIYTLFLLNRLWVLFGCMKGIYEALELRDGGSDYLGKGVLKVFGSSFATPDHG